MFLNKIVNNKLEQMNDSEEGQNSGKRPRLDSHLSNSPRSANNRGSPENHSVHSGNQEEFKGEVGGTIGTQKKKMDNINSKSSQDEAIRPA